MKLIITSLLITATLNASIAIACPTTQFGLINHPSSGELIGAYCNNIAFINYENNVSSGQSNYIDICTSPQDN